MAEPADLPGFEFAERAVESEDSSLGFTTRVLQEGRKAARREAAALARHGFREGVQEYFSGLPGEALSVAVVFASAAGARWEYATNRRELIEGSKGATRFAVAGAPEAVGYAALAKSGSGGFANVVLRSGRCFFLVGNALHYATSAAQLSSAPSAGALALYRRNARRCA